MSNKKQFPHINNAPKSSANPIDIHVGNQIKLRRKMLGLSQEKLADLLGITFQQVQKYEQGTNRISASRLWDVSNILKIKISYFFSNMNEEIIKNSPRNIKNNTSETIHSEDNFNEPMSNPTNVKLITDFEKISNPELKDLIKRLVSAIK